MTEEGAADGENQPQRFDRVPATDADRSVPERPSRAAIVDWWADRFGVDPATWDAYTFWERGAGKIWALRDDHALSTPTDVEGLGLTCVRTRQEHWKPTLEAAQRFGQDATGEVITLSRAEAEAFLAGHNQALDWDGDWGYLLVAHEVAGSREVIGVGLYLHGELRSQVPKGRRRNFDE
jgi:NOL1/NOP2/fmu family ribosome biogenesis protein